VATKLNRVRLEESEYRVASELFATSLDAYVLLGELEPAGCDIATADGKDCSVENCAGRLARVVCSEPEELGMDGVRSIAGQFKDAQITEIREAVVEVSKSSGLRHCLLAGSGEFLARQAVEIPNLTSTSLSREYGKSVSMVFPAYAAARLLEAAT
jgi:probable H4MPT-linked C1 transfer pathway protein